MIVQKILIFNYINLFTSLHLFLKQNKDVGYYRLFNDICRANISSHDTIRDGNFMLTADFHDLGKISNLDDDT